MGQMIAEGLLYHSTLIEVIGRVDLELSRDAAKRLNCSSFLANWANGADFIIIAHTGFGFLARQQFVVYHYSRQAVAVSPINSATAKSNDYFATTIKATVAVIGARVAIVKQIIVTRSKFAVKLQS